jgi:hypothetical protein
MRFSAAVLVFRAAPSGLLLGWSLAGAQALPPESQVNTYTNA